MGPWLDTALACSRAPLHGRFFTRGVDWPRWRNLERAQRRGELFDFTDAVPATHLHGGRRHGTRKCWTGSLAPMASGTRLDFRWFHGTAPQPNAVVLNPSSSGISLLESRLLVGPLLRAGFDVLIPRTSRPRTEDRSAGSSRRGDCSAARLVQALVDLARGDVALARWLRSRGYTRVLVAGLGFGGAAAGQAAARSDAFDACVIAMHGAQLADPWCTPAALRRALDWKALRAAGIESESSLRQLLEPFSLESLNLPPTLPGELVAARKDRLIPAPCVERLAARWDWPVRWLSGGHVEIYSQRNTLGQSLESVLGRARITREARHV